MVESVETETIYATKPQVTPMTGSPMPVHHQFVMPKRVAHIRYQRGIARPAAEVYLERLRALGVVGVVIAKDAEPSVRLAAQKTGVAVRNQGK